MDYLSYRGDDTPKICLCYGPIARLCAINQALFPIVVQLRVFWEEYWRDESLQAGLSEILFALEHLDVHHAMGTKQSCLRVWTLLWRATSLESFVDEHIIRPMCKHGVGFESKVALATTIMAKFNSVYKNALDNKTWRGFTSGSRMCGIPYCVCGIARHPRRHNCVLECDLLQFLINQESGGESDAKEIKSRDLSTETGAVTSVMTLHAQSEVATTTSTTTTTTPAVEALFSDEVEALFADKQEQSTNKPQPEEHVHLEPPQTPRKKPKAKRTRLSDAFSA